MKHYKFLITALTFTFWLGLAEASCRGIQESDELMSALSRNIIFERVWNTVDDNYIYDDFRGVDWQASKHYYGQEILKVANNAEFYETLSSMIFQLQDDHSVYLTPWETCWEDSQSSLEPDVPETILELQRLEQDPRIVLIRLKHFDTTSLDEEFSLALRETFRDGDISTVILDLRHNFGGYLDTAFNILGQFFYGKLGYETDQYGTYPLKNTAGKYYRRLENTRLIVLVDHESHSAAEIVAAVLQLERGATIIGTVSAGNTEIVLPYDFLDGSRLWLAVSKFTLRNGVSLEDRGVIPDLIVQDETLVLDKVLEYLASQDNLANSEF